MSRFKKKSTAIPEVSTASLPDIVFMLLFFFMTVTVMKDTTLKIDNVLPYATEVKKLRKKIGYYPFILENPVKNLKRF